MSLTNAAVLIAWVREELGAEVYLESARNEPPGWYWIRLRAPNLRNRMARARILAALNRNGSAVVQIVLDEQRQRGPGPVGAELVHWAG